jgi:hypothetical protein
MTKSILIAIFLFGLQNVAQAQNEGEIFTVYLARHAEQESEYKDPSNPPLSPCGEMRAESLAEMLNQNQKATAPQRNASATRNTVP